MRHCTHCGVPTDPDWHFCRRCGAAVDIEAVANRSTSCTECSHTIAPAWRFCSRCGTPTPMVETTRSTRVSDLDRWAEEVASEPAAEMDKARALTPEIVEDADVELISRRFEASAPADAPAPPPPPAPLPERPRLGEPAAPAEAAASQQGQPPANPPEEEREAATEPTADDVPVEAALERPDAPEWLEATKDPPVAIYSRDRLDTAPVDVADYYPADGSPPEVQPATRPSRDGAPADDQPSKGAGLAASSDSSLPAVWAVATPTSIDTRGAGEAPVPALFRDPAGSAAATRLGLAIVALLSAWTALGLFLLNNRIGDVASGEGSLSGMATAQTLVNGRIRPALIGATVITGIALMRWAYRSYANLASFGKSDLRAPRSAAVWSWLVPGLNLVLPAILVNDVWRGADVYARDDVRWRRRKGNRWVLVFALGTLIAVAASGVSLLADRASFQGAIDANRWLMLAAAAVVVACVGMARAVTAITARQQQRMASLSGLS